MGGGSGAGPAAPTGDQQAPLAAAAGLVDDTRMDITQLSSRGAEQDPQMAGEEWGGGRG